MKPEKLKLLCDSTTSVYEINRLIVTIFLNCNGIESVNNKYISSFIISESDSSFETFSELLDKLKIVTFDDLIKAFEFIISPVDKVVTGAIYTPKIIRQNIIDSILTHHSYNKDFTICDPACGCGGFLLSATKKIKELNPQISYYEIYKDSIFGLDLKEYSVERTKILLHLLAIKNGEDRDSFLLNIFVGNALDFDWVRMFTHDFNGFDVVIGNPPYVTSRNIDEVSLGLLENWSVCTTGHPDLYIPFFEIGISILKKGGVLGYITMNTFFKSLNGRALREFFNNRRLKLSITDFGSEQVFSSKNTYTCICIIEIIHSSEINYRKLSHLSELTSIEYSTVKYDVLDHLRGWNLSHSNVITKIENIGKPLKSLYKINTGIATLKNSVY
ncbi:N-6 DNA methylase, partial [Aeromonas hydrophila]